MKNSYIALAVFSMAALLVSCENANEIQDNTLIPGENDVVFSLGYNQIQTKSAYADVSEFKVATMDLGKQGDNNFFLDETVVNLDELYSGPETKGTPAYTENLAALYGDKLGVSAYGFTSGNDEVTFSKYADEMVAGGWQYSHKYDYNPWPATGSVKLYVRMPNDMSGVSVSSRADGKFTFTYTSPGSATAQQDILFGYRTATKAEYEASLPNGLPVLLNHALTGVKFAAANPEDVTIKSITIKGLYNKGTCVITPASETDNKDVTTNHSSASAADWSGVDKTSTGTFSSGDFPSTLYDFSDKTAFTDGKGNYPAVFGSVGGKNNLNDGAATQTFWIIPQAFMENNAARDVTLTVTYTLPGGTDTETLDIPFGALLAKRNVEWKAGQLYTYTLRIDEVNVMIEDVVDVVEADDVVIEYKNPLTHETQYFTLASYEGSTKTNVTITNTGNTDAYIRAALVGQWLDEQGNPVFGFTDYTAGRVVLVDSWYQDQFGPNAEHKHGQFEDLPGTKWVKGSDGYYYYTDIVPAGEEIPNDLFTSYTVGEVPGVAIAGESPQIYFRLEIATQAVNARKDDGSAYTSYTAAWNIAQRLQ